MKTLTGHSTSIALLRTAIAIAGCGLACPAAWASCGSAVCSVNTDWMVQGATGSSGSSLDLRYEFINQDQPQTGGNEVAIGAIPRHHDEVKTRNQNLVLTYHHSFDDHWSVSALLPVLDRDHLHIHNHHGEQIPERWNFTALGDLRIVGGYQFASGGDPLKPSSSGITFGLKLPTGSFNLSNSDGDVAERTLQPGTGTVDTIIGGYYRKKIPAINSTWFVQAQVQHALTSRDDYQPGDRYGIDLGYSYAVTQRLGALLQLNLIKKSRDSGAQAEPEDSGGVSLALSPGLGYALSKSTQIYGFVQLPVYQYVNGIQLTADKSLVVGISSRF